MAEAKISERIANVTLTISERQALVVAATLINAVAFFEVPEAEEVYSALAAVLRSDDLTAVEGEVEGKIASFVTEWAPEERV